MECMRLLIPNLDETNTKTAGEPKRTSDKDKLRSSDKDKDKESSKAGTSRDRDSPEQETSPVPSSSRSSPVAELMEIERISTVAQSPAALNALLGRLFFDFLKSQHWKTQIMNLIQKKLNYIKKPPFLEDLIIKDIYLGNTMPIIHG